MNRRDALHTLLGTAAFVALNPRPLFAADLTSSGSSVAPAPTPVAAPGSVAANAASAASPFDTAPIKIDVIVPDLRLLSGPGGNIVIYEGADELTVIDAGVPSRASDILAAISGLSSKPLRTLVNTHWHFDHVGANEAMAKAGARIYAQDNVRKRLSQTTRIEFFGKDVPPLPLVALPAVTFEEAMTLHPQRMQITHVPPAHTDGDSFVLFPSLNVVHTGDLFFNGRFPFIDASTGGSIEGMIAAADRLLGQINAETKIIPGHGPLGKREDLIKFRDMLIAAREKIKPLFDAGKTVDEAVAAKPIEYLNDPWGKSGMVTSEMFTKVVYSCLKHSAPTAAH